MIEVLYPTSFIAILVVNALLTAITGLAVGEAINVVKKAHEFNNTKMTGAGISS